MNSIEIQKLKICGEILILTYHQRLAILSTDEVFQEKIITQPTHKYKVKIIIKELCFNFREH